MQVVSSVEAKNPFDEVIMKAQQEPVCISNNGKPAAVIMSMTEYKSLQTLREQLLHQRLDHALDDVKVGRVRDGMDVNAELRRKHFNG